MPARLLLVLCVALLCRTVLAESYYINNVNVIAMDSGAVQAARSVLVRDGRVVAIGDSGESAVDEADLQRIDAAGGFLLPGLAEMHAHVPPQSRGEQYVQDVLNLYLANGITTIRGMLGEAWHLELRSMLAAGDRSGPRLVTSGPSLNGRSVSSPQQAAEMVREQHAAGYDFVKLHPGLERDEYLALVRTALKLGMPFAGHVSNAVGIPLTLQSGQHTIDHLDGYAQELLASDHPLYGVAPSWFGINLAAGMRGDAIPALARATAAAGVWNVPTQSLLENTMYSQTVATLMARPEMLYLKPATAARWQERVVAGHADISEEDAAHFLRMRRELLRELQQSGAGLLLGSDAPQIMNVPGFSIHEELEFLVAAGLTPQQALASGTSNVARFLADADRGEIQPGFVADLLLLDGNPLLDISNTRKVHGVMHNGRWFDREWIEQTLAGIRQRGI